MPVADPAERERVQAELDAETFHAYRLNREQTAFVLRDFHRVRSPRWMTETYFEMVPEKYDDLSDMER